MPRLKQLTPLQIALLISLTLHAALLLLRVADPAAFDRILKDTPLEVVLVNASTAAPTQAQVIAQRNLAGGGDAAQGRATSPLPPMMVNQAGDAMEESRRQLEQMQAQQMLLLAQVKRELAALPKPEPRQPGSATPAQRAEDERRRQLLALLAQIEKRIETENARPRRRYVSPAAREGIHAIYYDTLRQRIEEVGTRNFPEQNGRKLYGELTVMVAVDHRGQVAEVEVIRSSGNKLLDKRAVSIVRSAGPYGEFTPAMRARFDQLAFVSRFRFTREDGLRAAVQDAPAGARSATE